MPKIARRRHLTGLLRRGVNHKHSSSTRSMHLIHAEVKYRNHGRAAFSALRSLPALIVLYTYLLQGYKVCSHRGAVAAQCLIQIQAYRYVTKISTTDPQSARLSSWSNQECYDNTSFRKPQLIQIYRELGLAELAAQSDGNIRVFNGHEFYNYHPEEIFLFLMTRCKSKKG
ncbi:hypothetical protein ACHAXR_009912 [Thalassiosira sp. AJA248-18]